MKKYHEERERLIAQAIDTFKQQVNDIKNNPRWNHYSDKTLRRYDMATAIMGAAAELKAAYQKSRKLAEEARAYCEAIARDMRQAASDYTSPAQFGSELLLYDREIEGKLAMATKPEEVTQVFTDGTMHTTNRAQRYAWVRNLHVAIARLQETAKPAQPSKYWPGTEVPGDDLSTITAQRARLETLAKDVFQEVFPKYTDFIAAAKEAEEELEQNRSTAAENRLIMAHIQNAAVSLHSYFDPEGSANEILDTFAKNVTEWLEQAS